MKNIYITGYKGYIGSELLKRGFLPLECDVTDPDSVRSAFRGIRPNLVVHLAGKRSVDWCEDKQNFKQAYAINIHGVNNVFTVLNSLGIPGVFLSSDHIWRGGYFERHTEKSKPTSKNLRAAPVNVYGVMKLAAETFAHRTIRTSYIFDFKRLEKEIALLEAKIVRRYPVFIRRSFLHLQDFCDLLERYCNDVGRMPRVLHLSGSQTVSWYGFMKEMERQKHLEGIVKPRYFEEKGNAPRPWFGGLDIGRSLELGFPKINYKHGIQRMLNED